MNLSIIKSVSPAISIFIFGLIIQFHGLVAFAKNSVDLKPLVILISIDGFKPSYLERGITPNLNSFASNGVLAKGMLPVFPSITFPNHVSLITGQFPEHHGIVNNVMVDDSIPNQTFTLSSRQAVQNPAWWTKVNPIWNTLARQGKVSSTLFWPGSETLIQGMQPRDWLDFDGSMPGSKRIAQLISWLSDPLKKRADFATLYFNEVDTQGHHFGPDSNEVNLAISSVDQALGELRNELEKMGILDRVTFVITSDHGMATVGDDHALDVSPILKQFSSLKMQWYGPIAGFSNLDKTKDVDFLNQMSKVDHMSCWTKENPPFDNHFNNNKRIPDILCLAETGWTITNDPSRSVLRGQHGFDPNNKEMHALFIASGFQIPKKKIGLVKNIDVYNFLCKLMNVTPDTNDGSNDLINMILN